MKFLFDFGLSQEDPLTEQTVLDITPSDSVLSLASGGEVPLSLLSLNENVRLTAVDISESQIRLCRLKLTAAVHLDFPENGHFLGYAPMDSAGRIRIYKEKIRPFLTNDDARFWDTYLQFIGKGIIHAGRFEQYIGKMRLVAQLFMGKKNLKELISSKTLEEQTTVFDRKIATRKSLQWLFKVAFHPAVYKKRGLQEQALIHAGKTTGERFYGKFRDFCIENPASANYFLQFFMTGACLTDLSLPPYLQAVNKSRLVGNLANLELLNISFQDALREKPVGYFNKIHLSNLGDWITKDQFDELTVLFQNHCLPGIKICYRYLQKNHFRELNSGLFPVDEELSETAARKDRFPFYGIIPVTLKSQVKE
jgi:S-adenosylmethionine-diacylglycerol 3-amino-3-carboxypropyl transferase